MNTLSPAVDMQFKVEAAAPYSSAPKFFCNGFRVVPGEGFMSIYLALHQGGQILALTAFVVSDQCLGMIKPGFVEAYSNMSQRGLAPASALDLLFSVASANYFYGNFLDMAALGGIGQLRLEYFSMRVLIGAGGGDGAHPATTNSTEVAVVEMPIPVQMGVIKALLSL